MMSNEAGNSDGYVAGQVFGRQRQLAGHVGRVGLGVGGRFARQNGGRRGGGRRSRSSCRQIAGDVVLAGRVRRLLAVVLLVVLMLPRGRDLRPAQGPRLTC